MFSQKRSHPEIDCKTRPALRSTVRCESYFLAWKGSNMSLQKGLLYWAPRALCILFIVFVSLFALDVFDERLPFWRMLAALGMHLIPTFIMIVLLAISWRWEWVGATGFAALSVLYIVRMGGISHAYAVILVPALVIALLFLLNWVYRAELKPAA